jgi:histidinol dehydrogenase
MTAQERAALLRRSSAEVFDAALFARVSEVIEHVRRDGDAAVLQATEKFDQVALDAEHLRVQPEEFRAAETQLAPDLLRAIDEAIEHVRRFNEQSLAHASWRAEIAPGIVVGEQASPLDRVGLYVPCRKGSFPSVMIHLATPARVAGVPEIVVWLPALALGTQTIRPVRRINGPGSPGVTAAQLAVQRYGVAVGLLYGPSEALILADGTADPDLAAADLLNDAEHGPDSAALLITDDPALIDAVEARVEVRLQALPEPRRAYAMASTSVYGGAILVQSLDEGIAFINEYAPEHLQIATADPEALAPRIRNAGEILLGQATPFVVANFSLGVPNTLPTGGFAHLSSAVTVHTFLKRSTVARLSPEALARLRPGVRALATHEGFPAHVAALDAPGR